MERQAFALLARAEADHWWFRGRREFVAALLERLGLPPEANLLDAGCGSGGNLALLARFGRVYGFEYDHEALAAAAVLGIGRVEHGWLPDGVPLTDAPRFDVIGLFDVLEHLSQPVESLRALASRLTPGGAIVITVPALPFLWGPHDVAHQHVRRYTRRVLREQAARAGLRLEYVTHTNLLLLPLAIIQRLRERLFGYHPDDLMPSPLVNRLLLTVWRQERWWIPHRSLPVGLSLMAIARRAEP